MPANAVTLTATYEDIPTADAPTFSPAGGTFTTAQSVTLSCATDGAAIHYTTDGSTPTADSAVYSGPIDVSETTTIKAYAAKAGWKDSAVAEATYTIHIPTYTVTYRVVNGAWADGTAADRTETVTHGASPAGIPTGMTASSGYTGGAWDANPADAVITAAATFTYTFDRITYRIGDDGVAQAYYYDGSFNQVFVSAAAEGTELSLWIRENAAPRAGYYFTDKFTVKADNAVWLSDVTEFTMPAKPVAISAIQMPQEALTLAFGEGSKTLPTDAWMQIQALAGNTPIILYDEATGKESLDVNGDGLPDLLITHRQSAQATRITLTRLPACAAVGSFAFTFSGAWDHYHTITFVLLTPPAFGPADFTLPAGLTAIEASAFEGDTLIIAVDAHSCKSISAKAFKGCAGLTQIRVHQNCQINGAAFDGCGTVYVYAPSGGAAETSCADIHNCVFVEEAQN